MQCGWSRYIYIYIYINTTKCLFVCLFFFLFLDVIKMKAKRKTKRRRRKEMKKERGRKIRSRWKWRNVPDVSDPMNGSEREKLCSLSMYYCYDSEKRDRDSEWVRKNRPSYQVSRTVGMREWEREEWVTCDKIELGFIVFGFFLLKPNNYLSNWVDAHLIQIITGCV